MNSLSFAEDGHITSNPYALQKRKLLPLLSSVGQLTFKFETNDSHNKEALFLRRIQLLKKNSPEDPFDFCTGFLVGERLVATAAHCIQQDFPTLNLTDVNVCPLTNFRLETDEHLGASQYQLFQSPCSRVIYFNLENDQALIELEDAPNPSFFKPLPLSHEPPQVGETLFQLSLHRDFIETWLGTTPGHINACQVLAINQNVTTNDQRVTHGSSEMDCEWPIQSGESGSPIVNKDGDVIGIENSGRRFLGIEIAGRYTIKTEILLTREYFSPVVLPNSSSEE